MKTGNKPNFLVETALLTHGLSSICNEQLVKSWDNTDSNLAWIESGNIIIGNINEFLNFRNRADSLIRIDCFLLKNALKGKLSGALTASGTMAVCEKYNIPLAVTCGMGGIGDIKGEELCPDLPAIYKLPVALIATSPKDMLDIKATIEWLMSKNVTVLGYKSDSCNGFMFNGEKVKLSGVYNGDFLHSKTLLLREIPINKRLKNLEIIDLAIKAGKEAEKKGMYYHPAANAVIDKLSNGLSSLLQLESLIVNRNWAYEITRKI